jgi:hypothetical protein
MKVKEGDDGKVKFEFPARERVIEGHQDYGMRDVLLSVSYIPDGIVQFQRYTIMAFDLLSVSRDIEKRIGIEKQKERRKQSGGEMIALSLSGVSNLGRSGELQIEEERRIRVPVRRPMNDQREPETKSVADTVIVRDQYGDDVFVHLGNSPSHGFIISIESLERLVWLLKHGRGQIAQEGEDG